MYTLDLKSRKVLEDYTNIGRKSFNFKNSTFGKWVYNPLFSDKLCKIKNCSKGEVSLKEKHFQLLNCMRAKARGWE